jgi:hypothetical protein
MVATSLLTKFGGKAKEAKSSVDDFANALAELRKVSEADFLDINSLTLQKESLEEILPVAEALTKRVLDLEVSSSKFLGGTETQADALKKFKEENALSAVQVEKLEDKIKDINDELAINKALLEGSPLAQFELGVKTTTEVLVNQFKAGLIGTNRPLLSYVDTLEEYINMIKTADVDTVKSLIGDGDPAKQILMVQEAIELLNDTILKPGELLSLEDLGSDIDVFETRMMKLPSGLKDAFGEVFLELGLTDVPTLDILGEEDVLKQQAKDQQDAISQVMELGVEARAAEANAAMESAMEGSIFMAQKKLKELKESLLKENDLLRREELQAVVNQQQKIVNALTAGLGPVRTVLDDIIDAFDPSRIMFDPNAIIGDLAVDDPFIDVPTLDIIGEDDVLKQQATDRERAMTQVMKDGVDARLNEVNREIEGNKKALTETEIAEKGKQAARQLGVQGAQAVSQAIQGLFGESKEIAIAETIISTYFAAQKAFESQMLIPSPDAPIRANIAAGVAIAQGLARVAAIRSTDKGGGGGGGRRGSSGGGGGIGSRTRASGLFGTTDTASGNMLNNQPLFTPNASEKNRGIAIVVNNTFDDRTVASVASNGNDQRREGAVSGLGP